MYDGYEVFVFFVLFCFGGYSFRELHPWLLDLSGLPQGLGNSSFIA